jgi:hypothetical protein
LIYLLKAAQFSDRSLNFIPEALQFLGGDDGLYRTKGQTNYHAGARAGDDRRGRGVLEQPPYHPMTAPPTTSLKKQIPSSFKKELVRSNSEANILALTGSI